MDGLSFQWTSGVKQRSGLTECQKECRYCLQNDDNSKETKETVLLAEVLQ